MTDKIIDYGNATSSKKPRFALVPYEALVALVERFELGEEQHKGKTWNALSDQAPLENEDWVISRAEHAINHVFHFIQTYKEQISYSDDDAAAIMWAGVLLWCAMRRKLSTNIVNLSTIERQGKNDDIQNR